MIIQLRTADGLWNEGVDLFPYYVCWHHFSIPLENQVLKIPSDLTSLESWNSSVLFVRIAISLHIQTHFTTEYNHTRYEPRAV